MSSIDRSTIIVPEMLNKSYKIHNGKSYRDIKITADHIGHRLGEFFSTKTRARYKKQMYKKLGISSNYKVRSICVEDSK